MQASSSPRFTSLDVFRGMTVCLMIIVNTPGSEKFIYTPFEHAAWHGFTPTDLVFPSFLFAVGSALAFVLKKWQEMNTQSVLLKIFKRTSIIFLIGLALNILFGFLINITNNKGGLSWADIRIFGVLQRIALTYCFAALMVYYFNTRVVAVFSLTVLILYWPLLWFFGDPAIPLGLQTNAVLKFDKLILGSSHLYMGEGIPFDPEGILSTFPAIVSVLIGFLTGSFIRKHGSTTDTVVRLLMTGFAFLIAGMLWNYGFPINKKLWTSTFVLVSAGIDCMILGCILYYMDVMQGKTKGYFFQVFGKNPLFIYVLSLLGIIVFYIIPVNGKPLHDWLYEDVFSLAGKYLGSLIYALFYMFLCWLAGYALDKRKIYLRI